MRKEHLVTIAQARKLRDLGFNEEVSHYAIQMKKPVICESCPEDWNNKTHVHHIPGDPPPYLSVPTVYEAIDWFYKNYKIQVVTRAVDMSKSMRENAPIAYSACLYHYSSTFHPHKVILTSRILIGYKSFYAAMRSGIQKAITYVKENKNI